MKRTKIFNAKCLILAIAATAAFCAGCVDPNYDLSKLDETSEIKINNLTLPLRVDAITLSDIVESGAVKIVNIDGKECYAIHEAGQFSASIGNLDKVMATAPAIPPVEKEVFFSLPSLQKPATRAAGIIESEQPISDFQPQEVNIIVPNIDPAIARIDNIKTNPIPVAIAFAASNLPDGCEASFANVKVNFLKGMDIANTPDGTTYNPKTGEMLIPSLKSSNGKAVINFNILGIDFNQAGAQFENHTLSLPDSILIEEVTLKTAIDPTKLFGMANHFTLGVNTTLGDIQATHFSGDINYAISPAKLNIPSISLADVPAFLKNENVDLQLANPQITVSLSEPLKDYPLTFKTGIETLAFRNANPSAFTPDNNQELEINLAQSPTSTYILSAEKPSNTSGNVQWIQFSNLSYLLSGKGLPDRLGVNFINPRLPLQSVADFNLSQPIPTLRGAYSFFTPIALKEGSQIIYSETFNGWNDNTLKNLKITQLTISADVTSDIPLDYTISIRPLALNGSNIQEQTISVAANNGTSPISMTFNGEIQNLDGIALTAIVNGTGANPVGPKQFIKLENLRISVSGNYIINTNPNNQ